MMDCIDDARIRERAYTIWETTGRPAGLEADHWLRAESELRAERLMAVGEAAIAGRARPKAAKRAKPAATSKAAGAATVTAAGKSAETAAPKAPRSKGAGGKATGTKASAKAAKTPKGEASAAPRRKRRAAEEQPESAGTG